MFLKFINLTIHSDTCIYQNNNKHSLSLIKISKKLNFNFFFLNSCLQLSKFLINIPLKQITPLNVVEIYKFIHTFTHMVIKTTTNIPIH
jgi:hypothetical protein